MRILIVDEDMIGSSKLKLVFSKYGECDIASSGSTALDMFVKSHESPDPYGFITVQMDMPDMFKGSKKFSVELDIIGINNSSK